MIFRNGWNFWGQRRKWRNIGDSQWLISHGLRWVQGLGQRGYIRHWRGMQCFIVPFHDRFIRVVSDQPKLLLTRHFLFFFRIMRTKQMNESISIYSILDECYFFHQILQNCNITMIFAKTHAFQQEKYQSYILAN